MNRRDLIKGAATVIPSAVALQMIGAKFAFAEASDFKKPLDVLNYALTSANANLAPIICSATALGMTVAAPLIRSLRFMSAVLTT